VVLVTRGGEGTTVVAVERAVQISARPARVIDTIGAGDAFGGAWLGAWVAEGLGVADLRRLNAVVSAAEFAASVASRTCECAGAEPPRAARVDAEWCFAPAVADPNPIGARD
jgi:fructokinase